MGRRWIDLHLKAKHIWYRKLFILQTHLKAWGMILNSHQQIHTIRIATWQPQCLRPVPTITKTAFWPVPGCVAAAAPILASAEGKSIGLGFCVCLGGFLFVFCSVFDRENSLLVMHGAGKCEHQIQGRGLI